MQDRLIIETGVKRIQINDSDKYLEFNPNDVAFAERFYDLLQSFEDKQMEYLARSREIDENASVDENGVPNNMKEGLALLREVCEFLRDEIDKLFGKGTSQNLFGDTLSLNVFYQFFNGIMPFIQAARAEKVAKYTPATEEGDQVVME